MTAHCRARAYSTCALIARLEQCGYAGRYSIEMFDAGLWALPAVEAAHLCYRSLLPLCRD